MLISGALACTSDSPPDNTQTQSESSESIDESGTIGRKMLPVEQQPGYHAFPYASCPIRKDWESLCGGDDIRGFCIHNQGNEGNADGSICNAKCNDDDSCIPLGNAKMRCARNGGGFDGSYASCKQDSDCPEEMS